MKSLLSLIFFLYEPQLLCGRVSGSWPAPLSVVFTGMCLLPQLSMQYTFLRLYILLIMMTIFDGKKVCHYQVIYSKYETIRKFHVAHIKCKSNRRMRTMITIYIIKYVPYILRSLKSQHSNLCIEFSKYPTITLTGQ